MANLQGTTFPAGGDALASSNSVITSLSSKPATNLFGVSWIQTSQAGGLDLSLSYHLAPPPGEPFPGGGGGGGRCPHREGPGLTRPGVQGGGVEGARRKNSPYLQLIGDEHSLSRLNGSTLSVPAFERQRSSGAVASPPAQYYMIRRWATNWVVAFLPEAEGGVRARSLPVCFFTPPRHGLFLSSLRSLLLLRPRPGNSGTSK